MNFLLQLQQKKINYFKRILFFSVVFFICFSFSNPAQAATNLYVSPTGNDTTGTGAISSPFATLPKARDAVRTLIAAGLIDAVTVQLRAGTYRLSEPLVLTAADSGTAEYPITYTSYPGETATISGSRVVSGFTTWSGNIKRVADTGTFNSLFANGTRQIRARYPNYDPVHPLTGGYLAMRRGTELPTMSGSSASGETIDWSVNFPVTDTYYIWLAYVGGPDYSNTAGLTIDGGAETLLGNMAGSWSSYSWSNIAGTPAPAGTKVITAGTHTLQRISHLFSPYGMAAIVFTNDPDWKPTTVQWPLPAPAAGKELVYVNPADFTAATRIVQSSGGGFPFGYAGSAAIPAGTKTVFPYADSDVKPEWATDPNAMVHLWGTLGYESERVRLSSIDPVAKTVTVSGPEATDDLSIGRRYYVENILSELDSPGEWYLDSINGYLYYWPVNESDTVTVSTTGKLIISASGLRYVNFDGLHFVETDWGQAGGAIDYTNANHCDIRNSTFDANGLNAVSLNGGTENTIIGNTITNSGEGGVKLYNTLTTTVSDNLIHDIGLIRKGYMSIGIGSGGQVSNANVISNNTIYNAPRMGIIIGNADKNGGIGPRVEHNLVHDVCLETQDCGGIYFYQDSKINSYGTLARVIGNTIYNVQGNGWVFGHLNEQAMGMYIDGYSSGITVAYNLIHDIPGTGLFLQGGRNNATSHNTMVNNEASQVAITNHADNSSNNAYRDSISYAPNTSNRTMYLGSNAETKTAFDYNIYHYKVNADFLYGGTTGFKTFPKWQATAREAHSKRTDPLFVSASNFQLQASSPAIDAGEVGEYSTDILGNPIYGPPDIGAYEYQPTLTMGTNPIATPVRVYGDGKFRTTGGANSLTAQLSIIPQGNDTKKYLDVAVSVWHTSGDYRKQWTEDGPTLGTTPTDHQVGNLEPGKAYGIKVDNALATTTIAGPSCASGICLANSQGKITFTYTGGYSTHTFTIEDVTFIAKAITAFSFASPTATGTLNEANHTVTISVPAGTNLTNLTPTITYLGSSIAPAADTPQNFTNPVIYTVTAGDSSTQTYTVTVTFQTAPKKKSQAKRVITTTPKKAGFLTLVTQRGKRFSKNSKVALHFRKLDGSYYPPMLVKTDKKGSFKTTYLIKLGKPKGTYSWYATDLKTGKKSKKSSYVVR